MWEGHKIWKLPSSKMWFLHSKPLQNVKINQISNVQILKLVYDLHYYKMYRLSFIGKFLKKWWDQFKSGKTE